MIFTYHRVLPRADARYGAEQPGMLVTPETFGAHLRWMKRHFEPVHLSAWLDGTARPGRRPACAVTFDDGWRDNHTHALPLLRTEGVPATLFLATDFIGTARDFWPGRVQRLLAHGLAHAADEDRDWLVSAYPAPLPDGCLEPRHGDGLIEGLKRYPEWEIEERLSRIEAAVGLNDAAAGPVMLDWTQVRDMTGDGTVELGSHTRNHRRLNTGLAADELRDEVVGSGERIEQQAGERPRLFCYPNGDLSPEAERLVRETYQGACLVRRGWNTRDTDPYALCRVGMHEDVSGTRTQFLARASCLF